MIELVCSGCKKPADRIKLVINSNRLQTGGIFKEQDLRGGTYKLFAHCRSCKREGEIKKKNNLTWRSTQGSGWKELRDKKRYRYEF